MTGRPIAVLGPDLVLAAAFRPTAATTTRSAAADLGAVSAEPVEPTAATTAAADLGLIPTSPPQ
jgi:hypothetical protein